MGRPRVLLADDHDFVAGGDVHAGDVQHGCVHADGSHDGCAASAHEHRSMTGETQIEAVGVACRHDRNRRRMLDRRFQPVAGGFARPQPFHRHDTTVQ